MGGLTSLKNFQALTVKAPGLLDKIVTDIGVTVGYDPTTPPAVLPPIHQSKALWDTGASRSVISTEVAKTLGLVPVGTCEVHHGDGKSTRNTYVVNLVLPNHVRIVGILASDFPASHSDFSVLVGMDVIGVGDFALTHVNGQSCMSFRLPSLEVIDYVAMAAKIKYAGVGKNAPCPCKSGKKFKMCHGAGL